jgi:hypothetical protein
VLSGQRTTFTVVTVVRVPTRMPMFHQVVCPIACSKVTPTAQAGTGAQPDIGRGGRPPTTMIARSLSVLPSPSGTVTVTVCSPAERSAVSS